MFVSGCGDSASEGAGDGGGSDSTGESHEFDFSHFFPPTHAQETVVVQDFIEEVLESTEDRISITSYPGASITAPDTQYDSVTTGVSDIGLSVHSYTPGQFPLTSVMELPFISETGEGGSKILWNLYKEFEEIQDEYDETVPLWFYTSEPGQIITVGKPVESVEDLQGMRIRSPSPEVNRWLELLGATPVSMSMNETYEALERGVVDGSVAPMHALVDYSLYEVVDYITVGSFYNTTFFTVMNQNSWDSLSAEDQQTLESVSGESMAASAGSVFDDREREAFEAAEAAGVEIYEIPDSEIDTWHEQISPVIEEWIESMEDQGLPGREVYERALELSEELE